MRTELRVDGERAWLVLAETDTERREAALGLRFEEEGGELVRPVSPHDAALREIFARFAAQAPAMLDQAARRLPVPWEATLELVIERTRDLDWWLTGSAAAAVRGALVEPRDVDLLLTTADGALELGARLRDALVEPLAVGGDWIAEVFGRAFEGARIEWIGGFRPELDADGPNEFGPATGARLDTVAWRGHALRVPPLDVQIAVARERGLAERATALESLL